MDKLLQKLIILKQPRREGMRSDKQTRILEIPHTTKKTHAARLFSVEVPEQWKFACYVHTNLSIQLQKTRSIIGHKRYML